MNEVECVRVVYLNLSVNSMRYYALSGRDLTAHVSDGVLYIEDHQPCQLRAMHHMRNVRVEMIYNNID